MSKISRTFFHIILLLIFFSTSTSSIYAQLSPACRNFLTHPNASPKDTAACLVTSYLNPDYLQIFTNIFSSSQITKIDYPHTTNCTSDSQCQPITIHLTHGLQQKIPGTCQIPQSSSQAPSSLLQPDDTLQLTGTCVYPPNLDFSFDVVPKALDFANPTIPLPHIQNPLTLFANQGPEDNQNIINNGYFDLMLPPQEQAILRIYNLRHLSFHPELYLNAIPADYQVSCQSKIYTLQEIKSQLSTYLNLPENPNQFSSLVKNTRLYNLLSCVPIVINLTKHKLPAHQGLDLASLQAKIGSFSLYKSQTESHIASPHQSLSTALFIANSVKLSPQQITSQKQSLVKISPLASSIYPDTPLISLSQLVKKYPAPYPSFTADQLLHTIESDTLYHPQKINSNDIQQANAQLSPPGFSTPINLALSLARKLGITITKSFYTIPSYTQQIADALAQTNLQLQYSPSLSQLLIDYSHNKPLALIGSNKYAALAGTLKSVLASHFSTLLPPTDTNYCPINTSIDSYAQGQCASPLPLTPPTSSYPTDLTCSSLTSNHQSTLLPQSIANVIANNPLSPEMKQVIQNAAKTHHVPAGIILGVFFAEGGFQRAHIYGLWKNYNPYTTPIIPGCRSNNDSNINKTTGAIGPYQIVPSWIQGKNIDPCNFIQATNLVANHLYNGLSAVPDLMKLVKKGSQNNLYEKYTQDLKHGHCDACQYSTQRQYPTTTNWSDQQVVTAARYYRGQCDPKYFRQILYIYHYYHNNLNLSPLSHQ